MTREGCKEKKKEEEEEEEKEEDKKEQGEGKRTQVRCWNVFRNLLVGGDSNLFAKLLQVVLRRWSLAVKVLNSKEIQQAGRLMAFIEKGSMPEAHTPLLARINEPQHGRRVGLSFGSEDGYSTQILKVFI